MSSPPFLFPREQPPFERGAIEEAERIGRCYADAVSEEVLLWLSACCSGGRYIQRIVSRLTSDALSSWRTGEG